MHALLEGRQTAPIDNTLMLPTVALLSLAVPFTFAQGTTNECLFKIDALDNNTHK